MGEIVQAKYGPGEAYRGNPNLKRPGVEHNYTEHEVREFRKCARDPIYFIRTYVKIVHVDHGLVPFSLYDYQEKIVTKFKKYRFNCVLAARQCGKSTVSVAYILWFILFHKEKTVGILANKAVTARELLSRIQLAFEHLPAFLQQGIEEWNKGSIKLENGCKILATSTSSSSIRGQSMSLLMLDELAFVPTNVAEDFYTSTLPTISSGKKTQIIIVSTPNGIGNLYHKIWTQAEKGINGYEPTRVDWWDVPGRDEQWKQETIEILGSEDKFLQEYSNAFLGNSNTLIPSRELELIATYPPLTSRQNLDIFEEPIDGHKYVVTVDTSRGRGIDYSAFVVFDVTDYPYKQVAKFKDNNIAAMEYPIIIKGIADYYHEAMVLVETNDVGEMISTMLYYDFEYENMVSLSSFDKVPGIRTTRKTKGIGCANLKALVSNKKLQIVDIDTVQELSTFIAKGKSYEADVGCHDDLVMCLVMFAWFVTTDLFRDTLDQNVQGKIAEERMKFIEDDVMPVGFILDGTGDDEFDQEMHDFMSEGPSRDSDGIDYF